MVQSIHSIKAVAERVKRCTQTIRNLEHEGVVRPVRDSNGRRLYSEAQVKAIEAYLEASRGKAA